MRSRTLFTFKLEGQGFTPGWLPLRAATLLHELLEAAAEGYGSDPMAAERAAPQVQVTGRGSVVGVVGSTGSGLASPLRGMVKDLSRDRARSTVQEFVRRHFVDQDPDHPERFSYIELTLAKGKLPTVRLDASKAESLRAAPCATTLTTVYAELLSIGGVTPTARVRLRDGSIKSARLPSQSLAQDLAVRLYSRVKFRAHLSYDLETMETISISVLDFDPDWRQRHLADVVADGIDFRLDPPTLDELLTERGNHLRVVQ